MSIFIVKSPYSKLPDGVNQILCDPTLNYELYIFAKKEKVTFEDVVKIFLSSFSRSDYLGAMSLIYWEYYNEFYEFLEKNLNDKIQKKI